MHIRALRDNLSSNEIFAPGGPESRPPSLDPGRLQAMHKYALALTMALTFAFTATACDKKEEKKDDKKAADAKKDDGDKKAEEKKAE